MRCHLGCENSPLTHALHASAVAIVLVLLLAGCGGGHHAKFGLHHAASPAACGTTIPAGRGHMGACAPQQIKQTVAPPAAGKFGVTGSQTIGMDVSDYDSCQVGAGARFLIIKDGEGSSFTATHFACHVARAKQLGIPWGVYYFQRPGCQPCQASREVNLAAPYGRPPLGFTIDDEVGVPASQTQQFADALRALTGRVPVRYTAPGLYTGHVSGVYLWIADYGTLPSSFGSALAWQFSDGVYGPYPHSVGGFHGDIDQDRGLIAAENPIPVDPYAIYDQTRRHFGNAIASEHNTVSTWDRHGCSNPVRRSVCKSSRYHLILLRDRLDRLGHPGLYHRRARRHGMNLRLGGAA